MKKFVINVKSSINLTECLKLNLPYFSLDNFKDILKNNDIKVNRVRMTTLDFELQKGDEVTLFYREEMEERAKQPWYTVVYEDENILVVNKRSGIEVISEDDRDLTSILEQERGEIYAVHRIDRNTEGLVLFARNLSAKEELDKAFEKRLIHKYYLLEAEGKVDLSNIKERVYIKKLPNKSKVFVSDVLSTGYDLAVTKFRLIRFNGSNTILEADLVTGRTHQIRAHISYYGHPIIGDGKYGKQTADRLHLTSYKTTFNFKVQSPLFYLNDMKFEISPSWI